MKSRTLVIGLLPLLDATLLELDGNTNIVVCLFYFYLSVGAIVVPNCSAELHFLAKQHLNSRLMKHIP